MKVDSVNKENSDKTARYVQYFITYFENCYELLQATGYFVTFLVGNVGVDCQNFIITLVCVNLKNSVSL
jgi:hypothetical protein